LQPFSGGLSEELGSRVTLGCGRGIHAVKKRLVHRNGGADRAAWHFHRDKDRRHNLAGNVGQPIRDLAGLRRLGQLFAFLSQAFDVQRECLGRNFRGVLQCVTATVQPDRSGNTTPYPSEAGVSRKIRAG
jgi:hypothetical protein